MRRSLMIIPFLFFLGACSSSSNGGGSGSTTYSITGTVDTGATTSSLPLSPTKPIQTLRDLGLDFSPRARTQCSDGKFYSVYCMSFTTPPIAAEGDVDCSNGGAFTVNGLPLDEPIYCVVRRYDSASATSGSNLGAIEIPAANLNGGTDTIVGGGDLQMAVTLGSDGSITATVTGNTSTPDTSSVDAAYTAANINGVWTLTCDNTNGGSDFSAGACKCFLGENYYGGAGYANQDDCIADDGAAISQTVQLGIDMAIHSADINADLDTGGGTLSAGTTVKAISIWATDGSLNSVKTGGEGVTSLGGALTWATTPLDPTATVGWTTGNVNVQDGNDSTITINVPALPADPNVMTHAQWITWVQNVTAAAETGGFACTWADGAANANVGVGNSDLDLNIDCINQVMSALTDEGVDATLPEVNVQFFCDENGCITSADTTNDNAQGFYDANALLMARVDVRGWDMDYPQAWANSDNNSAVGPVAAADNSIGVEPRTRYVFEPLLLHPNGAGFRQKNEYNRHYECVSGAPGSGQVQDAACNAGGFYQLECVYTEELAIKFMGTSSPLDVIFDQSESPVAARLYHYNGGAPTEVNNVDTLGLCASAAGAGGFTFVATGRKQ